MIEYAKSLLKRVNPKWVGWAGAAVALYAFGYLTGTPVEIPDAPPFVGAQGRIEDAEATRQAIARIEAVQGFPAEFGAIAQDAIAADNDEAFFFWAFEEKILGKVLPSWNQGGVGSCVSFGFGRASQDLMLWQIVSGHAEEWPGYEIATEPIYGGSRVEIGGGRISGDGSVGAWAFEWLQSRGVNLRKKYQSADLTKYSESTCRAFGRNGVPDDIETAAKGNPVKGGARVRNGADVWSAIGNGYPVAICSNVGFNSPLKNGYCAPSGSWAHCMEIRGRFVHPTRGKSVVIQNSWGDYLRPRSSEDREIDVVGVGKVLLPEGCFACELSTADRIAKQNDSFALSNLKGFPSRKPNEWLIRNELRNPGKLRDERYSFNRSKFLNCNLFHKG